MQTKKLNIFLLFTALMVVLMGILSWKSAYLMNELFIAGYALIGLGIGLAYFPIQWFFQEPTKGSANAYIAAALVSLIPAYALLHFLDLAPPDYFHQPQYNRRFYNTTIVQIVYFGVPILLILSTLLVKIRSTHWSKQVAKPTVYKVKQIRMLQRPFHLLGSSLCFIGLFYTFGGFGLLPSMEKEIGVWAICTIALGGIVLTFSYLIKKQFHLLQLFAVALLSAIACFSNAIPAMLWTSGFYLSDHNGIPSAIMRPLMVGIHAFVCLLSLWMLVCIRRFLINKRKNSIAIE